MLFIALSLLFNAHADEVHLGEIHVLEKQSSLYDFLPSTTSLRGDEWQKKRSTNLGDSLSKEAGVNSGSFGPGSGRPVIRGLDGDRIRVLQNGLGTMDASAQSVDHAVPVDTLNTDQVDIVRGPMSLLYGASAVGGVININNQRIHKDFEAGAISQIDTQSESAYGGHATSARLDWGKNQWMTHLDGSFRDFGDQRISGNKRLNNSQVKQEGVAAGVSRVFDRGHVGFSVSHFGTQYGSVAEEVVQIHLRQNRYELGGEWRPEGSLVDKIRLRSAQSTYQHDEIEEGATGTVFKNSGNESRLEFLRSRGEWHHVAGLQTQLFAFSAKGEEAYLPKADNRVAALFSFHEKRMSADTFNFGFRVEDSLSERRPSDNFGERTEHGFTGLSSAIGWLHKWGSVSGGLTASYTERAPTFQELYSNGAHLATGTFEEGDEGLGKEKGKSLEATLRHETNRVKSRVSAFVQDFDHYIALTPTGATDVDSGFGVFNYEPVDARFYGMDAESRFELVPSEWIVLGKADWVRAKNLDNGQNLPRLSPARLSAGVEWHKGQWLLDTELQHVFEQHDTAANETRTRGYDMLDFGVLKTINWSDSKLSVFVRVKNIFDEKARNHVSFVKDIAPLPGRNIVAGVNAVW
ncbi:MAG: TonB-dependent receptor [Bacteriovoracia bacterium]